MLMVLAMLLTSLVPSFTANAAFSDVDNSHPYKEAITTLSTLDVINGYEDGTFAPDKEISRAEFTKMIVYMLNLGELSTPITTFEDVPQTHWANANIKTAYDLQIINGFDDGLFRPDDPVTYEQALKMVVCTLGYQPYAEQMGGYPKGYRDQASVLKLTDKVSNLGYSDNAPRGVIAQIMFNALEVEKHENVNGTWKASGKTLLNDYLNVEGLKGVLVGVEDSTTSDCNASLTIGKMAVEDSLTGEEYIIDFAEHEITAAQLIAKLGSTVQVYYRRDKLSNDKWLVELSDEIYSNTEITINASQITEYSGNTLKYREAGEKNSKTIKLDMRNLSIRYNGRAVSGTDTFNGNTFPDALNDLFNPSSENFMYGTVRFVANDSADTFSMIDIYNYETIVAQRALQTTDYKIIDKLDPTDTLTLNPDTSSYTFTLTRNGSEVEPTKIVANDVVNYAKSLDGTFITVKVSSKSISGKIDSLNTTKQTLAINGTTYNYSDYFQTYITTKEQRTLAPDIQVNAYTDAFGTIQWGAVTSSESYYPYAYVINVFTDSEDYYLRLFAPSSNSTKSLTSSTAYTVKRAKIADNAKLNGSKKTPAAIEAALKESKYIPDADDAESTTDYNQFIRVGFNSSGEIDNIITMTVSEELTTNTDNSRLIRYGAAGEYTVNSNNVKSGTTTLYSIKSSAPLFIIPSDRLDTEGYALKNAISSSSMEAGDDYFVEAYDVNSSKYPTFMAIYKEDIQSGTPITVDTKYSLIAEEADVVYDTESGNELTSYSTYTQSAVTSAKTISDEPLQDMSGIAKGDIVLFGYDSQNLVNDYKMAMAYSDVKAALDAEEPDYDWSDLTFEFGYPTITATKHTAVSMYNVLQALYDENKLYITKAGFDETGAITSESYETINITSNTVILRYDAIEETFTPYSADTTEKLTIKDIADVEYSGTACSKIAVISYINKSATTIPTINCIVIYE